MKFLAFSALLAFAFATASDSSRPVQPQGCLAAGTVNKRGDWQKGTRSLRDERGESQDPHHAKEANKDGDRLDTGRREPNKRGEQRHLDGSRLAHRDGAGLHKDASGSQHAKRPAFGPTVKRDGDRKRGDRDVKPRKIGAEQGGCVTVPAPIYVDPIPPVNDSPVETPTEDTPANQSGGDYQAEAPADEGCSN